MTLVTILTAYGLVSLAATALVMRAGYARGRTRTNHTASLTRRLGRDLHEVDFSFHSNRRPQGAGQDHG